MRYLYVIVCGFQRSLDWTTGMDYSIAVQLKIIYARLLSMPFQHDLLRALPHACLAFVLHGVSLETVAIRSHKAGEASMC